MQTKKYCQKLGLIRSINKKDDVSMEFGRFYDFKCNDERYQTKCRLSAPTCFLTSSSTIAGSCDVLAASFSQKMSNLEVGFVIGDFRVVRKLGAGGFGDVYLVRDERRRRNRVLKVSFDTESFLNEKKILTILAKDTNFPEWVTDRTVQNAHFLFMSHEGNSVAELLHNSTNQQFSPMNSIRLATQLVKVIWSLHTKKIIHRDIHAKNVLLKQVHPNALQVKLCDFGISKDYEVEESEKLNFKREWASVFAFRGEIYDRKDDLYSVVNLLIKTRNLDIFNVEPHELEQQKLHLHWSPEDFFHEQDLWIAKLYDAVRAQNEESIDYRGGLLAVMRDEAGDLYNTGFEFHMAGEGIFVH